MLIKIGTHWVNVVNATAVNRVRLQKVELKKNAKMLYA